MLTSKYPQMAGSKTHIRNSLFSNVELRHAMSRGLNKHMSIGRSIAKAGNQEPLGERVALLRPFLFTIGVSDFPVSRLLSQTSDSLQLSNVVKVPEANTLFY